MRRGLPRQWAEDDLVGEKRHLFGEQSLYLGKSDSQKLDPTCIHHVLSESEGKVCGDWSAATRPAGAPTAFSQYSEDNNRFFEHFLLRMGLPGGSDGIESAHKAGDPGSIPEFRRSPGEGNGNLL